ncbi:hypothetical protein DCO46_00195 [Flavobacterium sp. HTF]|nr:hypothetical protein DCO46_00195 [Flavobacterium sp. HTF]
MNSRFFNAIIDCFQTKKQVAILNIVEVYWQNLIYEFLAAKNLTFSELKKSLFRILKRAFRIFAPNYFYEIASI